MNRYSDGLRRHLEAVRRSNPGYQPTSIEKIRAELDDSIARIDRLEAIILKAGVRSMRQVLDEMPAHEMD